MTQTNITILGTSHIAKQSIKNIRKAFENKPDFVCVELDRQRLYALMNEQKQKISLASIPQIGLQGYLFAVVGRIIQQKLGSVVGLNPGSDMLEAVKLASENKIKVCLIDRDIRVTLKRFSKGITWKERLRFLKDLVISPFDKKQRLNINLAKVPDKKLITFILGILKERYPSVYRTLVEERNNHMARQLFVLANRHPGSRILAVVGAGHEEGMNQRIGQMIREKSKFEVV